MGELVGDFFGGGSGGSGRDSGFIPFSGGSADTSAFNLDASFSPGGILSTRLKPKNTIFQQANLQRFPRILTDIDTLRSSVRPFASDIRRAGLGALAARRSEGVGTLRESLARRGVLGSSFANDAILRANAEFAQQEAQFEAEVGQQEFTATQAILAFEQEQLAFQLNREFQELGLAANFAAQMAQTIAGAQNTIAQLDLGRAQLKTQERGQNIQANKFLSEEVRSGIFGGIAASSRDLKNRVGGGGVLDGLETLDIHRWRYKGDAVTHVGPYAEDFQEIFGVGDGKTLHIVDVMGVMLGAVKELAAEVAELRRER